MFKQKVIYRQIPFLFRTSYIIKLEIKKELDINSNGDIQNHENVISFDELRVSKL